MQGAPATTLGLEHEHQHPERKLEWNETKVVEFYKQSQGWDDAQVREQVTDRKRGAYVGTQWDHKSIMHYPFPSDLITVQSHWNCVQ